MDQDFPKGKTRAELLLILHRQSCLLALGDAMREGCVIHLELSGGWKCRVCFGNDETGHKGDCPVAAWDKERK
jgi:hypothetical protein